MTWRQSVGREPVRSRTLIVAGAVGMVGLIWATGARSVWLVAVSGAWLAVLLVTDVVRLIVGARAPHRERPARFVLTNNGFGVPPIFSPGLTAVMPQLILGVFLVAMLWQLWREDPHPGWTLPLMTALIVFLAAGGAVATVGAWRGLALELTPAGVHCRGPLFYRLVPWEALGPGGPPRLPINASRLNLVVARPELVVQRGWPLWFGPRQSPVVALQVNVHPWFLADAIRWYAEHPADRAAIGTRAEHERLVAALPAAQPGP